MAFILSFTFITLSLLSCRNPQAEDTAIPSKIDADADGFSTPQDCNDNEATINPEAEDLDSDGIDQNCDGIDGIDTDGDGYADAQTGGDDCNDEDPFIHPEQYESCDSVDQNCNGILNDGIECVVYVHAFDELYRIDPFALSLEAVSSAPGLFDSAALPDGTLLGLSETDLLAYDESNRSWSEIGSTDIDGEGLNGFDIDQSGQAFGTIGNTLYEIDTESGVATVIGALGNDFRSSGDCAVDALGTLYMTSLTNTNQDDLIQIDPVTGRGSNIGNTGFSGIYALSFAWGHLFGFTVNGEMLRINSETGSGSLIHVFEGYSFTGAASGSER